jgi:hypothetical protein
MLDLLDEAGDPGEVAGAFLDVVDALQLASSTVAGRDTSAPGPALR